MKMCPVTVWNANGMGRVCKFGSEKPLRVSRLDGSEGRVTRGEPFVRNNDMVAREPLGPARLSCIYMVFSPYLTSLILYTIQYTSLEHLTLRSNYINIPPPITLIS